MRILRHIGERALLAAILFVPFIGIRLNDGATPSGLSFHLGEAALFVAAAVVVPITGRLIHLSLMGEVGEQRETGESNNQYPHSPISDEMGPSLSHRGEGKFLYWKKNATTFLIFAALALPMLPFVGREAIDLITLVLVYAMLAAGLNIVVGFTGLLDLGFIAFFAIGAYSYGILGTRAGLSFWECLPLAALLPAFASLILGLPVLRLRGDYFAIVTLGFGQIVYTLLVNWSGLTHGSQGITGIPRPSLFGVATFSAEPQGSLPTVSGLFGLTYSPVQRVVFLYYLILVLVLLANWLTARLRCLPLGRAWEAVREDEIAAAASGISRARVKLAAYAISAATAGLAGAFFAARQGFISPESFTFMDSAIVLAIVVLGGSGSQWGVLLAAFFLIGTPEVIREFADYRMLVFGAAMVLVMLARPRGLSAKRTPSVTLGRA